MPKHKWVQHILHICQRDDWWMTSKRSTIIQTQCERSLTHFAAFTLPSQRFGTLLAAFTWLAHRSAKCYGNHWTLTHYALNVCGEMNDPWGTPPLESGIKIWTQHRRLTYVSILTFIEILFQIRSKPFFITFQSIPPNSNRVATVFWCVCLFAAQKKSVAQPWGFETQKLLVGGSADEDLKAWPKARVSKWVRRLGCIIDDVIRAESGVYTHLMARYRCTQNLSSWFTLFKLQ